VAFGKALMEWWDEMTLYYNGVQIMLAVMPSGFVLTLLMNSVMNQNLMICNVLQFCREKGIIPPFHIMRWIRHKALGDDSQTAIKKLFVKACKDAGVPVYSAIDYARIMKSFGITATMGDKSETTLAYQDPAKLVFLQHVMWFLTIPAYTYAEVLEDPARRDVMVLVGAAPLKAPVIVKMLAKQDAGSTVLPQSLLMDQVYIIMGELVPYGRDCFDSFVCAVRRFSDPVWKPPDVSGDYDTVFEKFDWNFWLSRYVEKFCRNGRLDPAIVEQRQNNKKSFRSLKLKLNPNGIDELNYDFE
jgi:hypothetical protein